MSRFVLSSLRTPLVAGVALLGLSACGSGINPGAAAQLGEVEISTAQVDDYAAVYCESIQESLGANAIPQGILRSYVLSSLASREIARQVAKAHSVSAGSAYEKLYAEQRTSIAATEPGWVEALSTLNTTEPYLSGVAEAIGRRLLSTEGVITPTAEMALQRGTDELTLWSATHETWVDGRFDVAMGPEGTLVWPVRADVSVALDEPVTLTDIQNAIATLSGSPDQGAMAPDEAAELMAALQELPATQRCGPAQP